jgi:hypothetical protein
MKDGSVFKMPNELRQKAFNLECDDPSVTIEAFKEITRKHWLRAHDLTDPKEQKKARDSNVFLNKCVHFVEKAVDILIDLP